MIVCLGDSITFGQHVDVAKAWPRLLPGVEIMVAGVPGDTTRLGLERFARQVQDVEPETVVIQFGHNDANRWKTDHGLPRVSPAAFKANLVEMVDRARTFNIQPILCTLTPTARSTDQDHDVRIYDGLLRRVADDESVPLADVRAAFLDYFSWQTELVMADGLHLTERGHVIYAGTVTALFDRLAIG